jgi:hypothetical protein
VAENTNETSSLMRLLRSANDILIFLISSSTVLSFIFGIITVIVLYLSSRNFFTSAFYKWPNVIAAINATALFVSLTVSIFLYFRYDSRKRQLKTKKRLLERLARNNTHFHTLSEHHTNCDKALFDLFLTEFLSDLPDIPRSAPVADAINHVKKNVDDILNNACVIYRELTGFQCAACIKIIDALPTHPLPSLLDLRTKTYRRDSISHVARAQHVGARSKCHPSANYR